MRGMRARPRGFAGRVGKAKTMTLASFVPIADPSDPRVAAYRDVRERDLVGRQGLFIAEGEVVLNVLARQRRHHVVSLLVAEKRAAKLSPLLKSLDGEVEVFVAGQAVMDAVAGFPMHRGILALGRRAADVSAEEALASLGPRAVVLALFGIANHDNIGGIFRNAAAFGADLVLLDPTCCDPLYRKAIRVSVGGALVVPFARLAAGEAFIDLMAGHGFVTLALAPRAPTPLTQAPHADRLALALGAEGPGLADEVLTRAINIGIAMAGGLDSLNVATTSGIVLHHLMSQRG